MIALDDAHRDAVALTLCALRKDAAGVDAILASAELGPVMMAIGEMIGECLAMRARVEGMPDELIAQSIDLFLTGMLQGMEPPR